MLRKLKFTVSFLAVLAIAIFIAYSAKDLAEPITLSIPSCDIEVECEYCKCKWLVTIWADASGFKADFKRASKSA